MHSSTLAHPESLLSVSNLGAPASTRTAVPSSTSRRRTDDTSSSDLSPLAGELFLPTTDTEPPVTSLAAATATAAPPPRAMTPELTPSSPAYTAQPEPPHARTHSTAAASSLLPNIRAPSLDDDATAVVSLPCRLELSSLPFSALRSSP
ncbi:unnamed protein product, partial [Laminaria digitata]